MAPIIVLLVGLVSLIPGSWAHGGHGAPQANCEGPAASMAVLDASYVLGTITVDGDSSDWDSIEGHQFALYPALNPQSDPYPEKMTIKAAHDGRDLFFLLQVPGAYQYKQGDHKSSSSVALMFPVGDDATYIDMGGCSESLNCSSCTGHEVDIMHFSLGNAVPGRIYGANLVDNLNGTGKDSFGSLHDLYALNPHCRYYDGIGPDGVQQANGGGQNDWRGCWSHTSIKNDFGLTVSDSPYGSPSSSGVYVFEFTRPLRTSDRLQQDAQFTIGKNTKMAAAFWYPMHNAPWSPSQHYSANCDWIPMRIRPASRSETTETSILATSISTFSLIFALGSLLASGVTFWWLKSNKQPFVPISTTNL